MTTETMAAQAEKLSRRRARLLPAMVVLYLSQQASFFSQEHGDLAERAVDQLKISAWVVFSLVLLALLLTKGFWLRSPALRDIIDDETTRANRLSGVQTGFVMAMLTAIAVYFISMYEVIRTREAIHLVVSLGIGAALLRFAFLERRALRDA